MLRCVQQQKCHDLANIVVQQLASVFLYYDSLQTDFTKLQKLGIKLINKESIHKLTNLCKKIQFLPMFFIKLCSGNFAEEFWTLEDEIKGTYVKYTNNYNYVNHENGMSNLAQIFSHLSFVTLSILINIEHRQNNILNSQSMRMIVDIQGVNTIWTDPAVHSTDDSIGFGNTNLSLLGIRAFFKKHNSADLPCCHLLGQINENELK